MSSRPQTFQIQLVSVETAAELLAVSRSTVRRLIKNKRLRAIRIGGQLRIRMIDLCLIVDNEDTDAKPENDERSPENEDN